MDYKRMAQSGLVGMRGKLATKIADPIAKRTPMTREQIEVALGAALLVLTAWRSTKVFRNAWRAGKADDEQREMMQAA